MLLLFWTVREAGPYILESTAYALDGKGKLCYHILRMLVWWNR